MQDKFNRDLYYNSNKADILAVLVAFVITILAHIGAYYVIPQEFVKFGEEQKKYDDLKIEVLPPKIEKRMPDFIEANPYANNEKPASKDAPESFKDQRASDELPDPTSKSKKPYVEGEIKDGKKIVSGTSGERDELSPQKVFETLERPLEQPAQLTESSLQQSTQEQSQQSSTSTKSEGDKQDLSQTEKPSEQKIKTGDSAEETSPKKVDEPQENSPKDEQGFIKIEKRKETDSPQAKEHGATQQKKENPAPQKKNEGAKKSQGDTKNVADKSLESQQEQQKVQEQKQEQKPQEENLPAPRPRPTLSMKIPAGPLADNRSHASKQGVVACDSRFSEFGAYQQRMLEAISRQWNLLASKYDLGTAVGTMVIIEYYLNTMGELSKFKILHTTSTNTGTGLCEQSILTTAPYGEWTQEMVNTFGGQDQSVRITFHYR